MLWACLLYTSARFGAPLMLADDDANPGNFTELVDWLIAREGALDSSRISGVLSNLSPNSLLPVFYPVCSPAWYSEDVYKRQPFGG